MPNGKQGVLRALCLLGILYVSIGVFPFAPMESDGNHISNGVTQMLLGNPPRNPFSYRYEAQSGTYWMTYWVSQISGLQAFDAFCLLSAVGALIFLLTASFSLARLTGEDFALVGLCLLAFQEVWTNAYYANSNILATAFLFSGFLWAIRSEKYISWLAAGLIMGLGVWARFDALIMLPVLPLLVHRKSWHKTLLNVSIAALGAGIAVLFLLHWSDVTLSEILASSQRHFQLRAATTQGLGIAWLGNSNIKSHLAYISFFIAVLLGLGFLHLLLFRQWKDLGIFLFGVLPLYCLYLGDLTSPKYLLYAAPFFAFLALKGWQSLAQSPPSTRLLGIGVFCLLFIGQYGLGVRLRFVAKPYYYPTQPTWVQLLRISLPFQNADELSVVLGAGARISTVDRDRLFSGILFAPLMWRSQKMELNGALHHLVEHIQRSQETPVYLLVDENDPLQQVLIFLFRLGYQCEKLILQERFDYPCRETGGQSVILMELRRNAQRQADVFVENLATANVDHFFFVVTAPWQEYLIDQNFFPHSQWEVKKLSTIVYEFNSK